MANNNFPQNRSIDPYAGFNSNEINKVHRIVSHGSDGILGSPYAFSLIYADSTSVALMPGSLIKDDVLIENTSAFTVKFNDSSFYASTSTGYFNEAGTYYIVCSYKYQKINPAPQAAIYILMPSQIVSLMDSTMLFLGAVTVTNSNSVFSVGSTILTTSPDSTYTRDYAKTFMQIVQDVPLVFDPNTDAGRLIYCKNLDAGYYGDSTGWTLFSSGGGGGGTVVSSLPKRTTATITTQSLASNGFETGTVILAPTFNLIKVVGSCMFRLRLYSSQVQMNNDANRDHSTPVTAGTQHGLICDVYVNDTYQLNWIMSPSALGSDASGTSNIHYNITNISGSTQQVTLNLIYLPLEATSSLD